jgi:hypothetical protein
VGPFEDTLAAVLQNRPASSEVIVALAAPYDDPHGLADEVIFTSATDKTPELVSLVNRALAMASAPVLHIVPCGYRVSEGWTGAALLHFDEPDIAAVASVLLSSQRKTRVVAAGLEPGPAGTRRLAQAGSKYSVAKLATTSPAGATLAGGYFRKSVVEALGGFDEALGLGHADLDFALCAQALGLHVECEPTSVLLAREVVESPVGRFNDGRRCEIVRARHGQSATASHWLRLAGEAAWCLVQPWWLAHVGGRLVGQFTREQAQWHAARLARAKTALEGHEEDVQVVRLPLKSPAGQSRKQRRAA